MKAIFESESILTKFLRFLQIDFTKLSHWCGNCENDCLLVHTIWKTGNEMILLHRITDLSSFFGKNSLKILFSEGKIHDFHEVNVKV